MKREFDRERALAHLPLVSVTASVPAVVSSAGRAPEASSAGLRGRTLQNTRMAPCNAAADFITQSKRAQLKQPPR